MGRVALQVLPKAKGAVSGKVEGVKPGSCQITELINNLVSQLLGEGEGEVVSGRVEEKRKEDI